jgi:hypothetical protein
MQAQNTTGPIEQDRDTDGAVLGRVCPMKCVVVVIDHGAGCRVG